MIIYNLKTHQIIDTCPDEEIKMPKKVVEIFAKRIFEEFQKTQNIEWQQSNNDRAYW